MTATICANAIRTVRERPPAKQSGTIAKQGSSIRTKNKEKRYRSAARVGSEAVATAAELALAGSMQPIVDATIRRTGVVRNDMIGRTQRKNG